MEEPKDPNSCNVFALYKLMASESEIASMKANYEGGNYGYGHAKQALFELLIEQFSKEREMYNYYMENLDSLILIKSAKIKKEPSFQYIYLKANRLTTR